MRFFEKYFNNVDFNGAEEVKVLCPFHSDTNPSASINTEKSLFHCFVCGVGYNEAQFIAKINGISVVDAHKVLNKFEENLLTTEWRLTEKAELWSNKDFLTQIHKLGLSNETIDELDLGIAKDDKNRLWLGIPVFYNDVLMSIRKYNLLKIKNEPKLIASANSQNGFVIPYDLWKKNKTETTYILEGEKDMLLARDRGLNAITITGGAQAIPNEFVLNEFKDRKVVLCYDNDDAGREGMRRVYSELKDIVKEIKYLNISDVVKENKEDFSDFIMKYEKDVLDFLMLEEHEFTKDDIVKKQYTTLKKALKHNKLRKKLVADVIVSASFEDSYAIPTHLKGIKKEETGKSNERMFEGEVKNWYLEPSNMFQFLEIIEIDAKRKNLMPKYLELLQIDKKEENVVIKTEDFQTIYKVKISDKVSDFVDEENDNLSIDLYTQTNMSVGSQYEIEYTLYPHPTKHQKIVAIATKIKNLSEIDNFIPDKQILNVFRSMGSTVEEKLNQQYEAIKHHIAKHLDFKLWLASDLVFNSILEFDYVDRIRGTLDLFILGDTQVGKSETTSALTKLYNFGHFLSLKTSTTVGLVGGSNKVEGNWLNTIGAIPRQNKKLVVMEEFSGAKPDFIKTITEMRSSNKLRLARAAGELLVPCMLRMITISNPINDEKGNPRHLNSFPNGVIPVMELIKSAEDVARYDAFLLVERPKELRNPFALKLTGTKLPVEFYQHKIGWVYSRRPEDVIFEEDVASYIWEKANELNKMFLTNFPIFGTTTSLKLARFSVAMSSLIVNTDDTMEKVIVSKEIVDYAYRFIISLYDNETFKLKEYKEEYDSYSKINQNEIEETQKLYDRNSTMFLFLENQSSTSRNNLKSVSGIETDNFNALFNALVRLKLIRISGDNVYPTQKFRLGMKKIKRTKKSLNDEGSLISKIGKDVI